MYSVEVRKSVEKIFSRLAKKDYKQLEMVEKKVNEIIENPHHYKNLRKPLQHLKRVHVAKSFVLVFSVDGSNQRILIEDYDHHDNIYK